MAVSGSPTLDRTPLLFNVVGWDGYYYPWALNIDDFEPIVGSIHQPPPVHQTFEGDGFVVMSRQGIEYGSITLHPDGLSHGPHPGKAEGSVGKERTDELAVMVDTFRPLRVASSALALEGKLFQIVRHGEGPLASNYIIGEVVQLHVDDRFLRDGVPDHRALDLIGRLGGEDYCHVAGDSIFPLPRPEGPGTQ